MSVKIQINSLEALERLIGGDSELEIEIRSSIVENFAKKHLNSIANSEILSNASKAIRNEIYKTFFEVVKSGTGWTQSSQIVFKKEHLKELKQSLDYQAKETLSTLINEAIGEVKTREKINAALESASNYIVNSLTEANLTQRLNRMVDAKLKERLGL